MSSTLLSLIEAIALMLMFWLSAEILSRGIERLERFLGQGMTGGVILGFITSLPETIFVVIATLSGSYDVSLGSAVGGNIILFTIGIGLIVFVSKVRWGKGIDMVEDYKVEYNFLLLSTIVVIAIMFYSRLDTLTGLILCVIYFIYVLYRYKRSRTLVLKRGKIDRGELAKSSVLIISGAIIILVLSNFFVEVINELARSLNVSSVWLSMVISPIAAELEEKISAYKLTISSKGGGSIAVYSFIGSKIENNTLLLGLIGLLSQGVSIYPSLIEFAVMIIINLMMLAVLKNGKVSIKEGLILSSSYFLAILFPLIL